MPHKFHYHVYDEDHTMSTLPELCKLHNITVYISGGRFVADKEWPHIACVATLSRDAVTVDVPYRQEIGHLGKKAQGSSDLTHRQNLNGWKKPTCADVIASLLVDTPCEAETFEDFCDTCGYDTDSRKALDLYLACQESVTLVRKLLGTHLSLFQEAAQEYLAP